MRKLSLVLYVERQTNWMEKEPMIHALFAAGRMIGIKESIQMSLGQMARER